MDNNIKEITTTPEQEQKEIALTNGEVVYSTDNMIVVSDGKGGYKKVVKYEQYMSKTDLTPEEQVSLFKVLSGTDESVVQLKQRIGQTITFMNVYTKPYERFDETSGEVETGVVTVMVDDENKLYYATSSKAVYFTLMNLFEAFGHPNTSAYTSLTFKVIGVKKERGTQINIDLLSVNK